MHISIKTFTYMKKICLLFYLTMHTPVYISHKRWEESLNSSLSSEYFSVGLLCSDVLCCHRIHLGLGLIRNQIVMVSKFFSGFLTQKKGNESKGLECNNVLRH